MKGNVIFDGESVAVFDIEPYDFEMKHAYDTVKRVLERGPPETLLIGGEPPEKAKGEPIDVDEEVTPGAEKKYKYIQNKLEARGFRVKRAEDRQNSVAGGGDFRNLEVPDNAVSISDRSEAPEGATVVEGDRGGLYYVPEGESGNGGDTRTPGKIQEDVRSRLDSADDPFQESADIVAEAGDMGDVTMPTADTREDLVQLTSTLAYAGERGMLDPVEGVDTGPQGDAVAAFRANDNTLRFKENVSNAEIEGSAEEGKTVGDDLEWLVLHELGHAHHFEEFDSLDEIGDMLDTGMSVGADGEWLGRDRVDMVDEEVSSYGRTSHGEFVAEVFSGKAMGQEFSEEVNEVYDELGGPTNWEDYQP